RLDGTRCTFCAARALALSGLDASTPDPLGGHLGRTASGELDGNFIDLPALHLAILWSAPSCGLLRFSWQEKASAISRRCLTKRCPMDFPAVRA
ncbi:hypothetical protein FK513_31465, partial [Klebsiella pneumoniae]|uniref:hypothetical protein n=1 Tax=Klebsiella pneumoniae TaxID=573 RepID=UPI00210CD144